MFKRIFNSFLIVLSVENALFAKCLLDGCQNSLVFINKNAAKNGPSVCKAKDGSLKPFLYYGFRTNDGQGASVTVGAAGLNSGTGLCQCGHAAWVHSFDKENFPLAPQAQNAQEIPDCPPDIG